MANNTVQYVSIVVFTLIGLLAGYAPTFFNKRLALLSYMNIFAAGVFLSIGVMTILPDCAQDLDDVSGSFYDFPLAYFLVLVGFFLIFACEEIAHNFYKKAFGRSSHSGHEDIPNEPINSELKSPASDYVQNNTENAIVNSTAEEEQDSFTSARSAIVLLTALSIHEILEGFGIGAQENPTWGLFVAIVFHKSVESFALGAAFVRAKVPRPFFLTVIFFYSLTLPVGIAVGMAAQVAGNVGTGIVLALSAGSFLFISTAEIIPEEFSSKYQNDRWLRYACLVFGTLLMSLMTLLEHIYEGDED